MKEDDRTQYIPHLSCLQAVKSSRHGGLIGYGWNLCPFSLKAGTLHCTFSGATCPYSDSRERWHAIKQQFPTYLAYAPLKHFEKYAYSLCGGELDEKIHTMLISVIQLTLDQRLETGGNFQPTMSNN